MDRTAKARKLFDSKITSTLKTVDYRARNSSLREVDLDDLRQTASLCLWRQCLRSVDPAVKPFEINCRIIALAAWDRWAAPRRRRRRMVCETDVAVGEDHDRRLFDICPAKPVAAIQLADQNSVVSITLTEARQDHPCRAATIEHGIGATEIARRLGVSRQRVYQLKDRLGAIRVGRRWLYPADIGRG